MFAENKIFTSLLRVVAATFVVATTIYSCKEEIDIVEGLDISAIPTQVVENMTLEQTEAGYLTMRLQAPLMENYANGEPPYEIFPKGMNVKAYTREGLLETEITANIARHIKGRREDRWEAFGNVVVNNYIKGETIETDTLYWDKTEKRIYTHCFVKLRSPSLFMQGYGMESDEMARNAIVLKPFNSYSIIADSTEVLYVDSVNFIGPLLRHRL